MINYTIENFVVLIVTLLLDYDRHLVAGLRHTFSEEYKTVEVMISIFVI